MVLMGRSRECSGEVLRCLGCPEGSETSPEGLFQGASGVVREGVPPCSVGSKLRGSGDALEHMCSVFSRLLCETQLDALSLNSCLINLRTFRYVKMESRNPSELRGGKESKSNSTFRGLAAPGSARGVVQGYS